MQAVLHETLQTPVQVSLKERSLSIEWLSFKTHGDQIKELREKVFVEQQGFERFIIANSNDIEAIHLGCLCGGELISVISAYINKETDSIASELNLPKAKGYFVNFSRRAQLPEYDNTRLAQLLASIIWKAIYDTIQPEYSFIALGDEHIKLSSYYSSFGYKFSHNVDTLNGRRAIFILTKENLNFANTKIKRFLDVNSAIYSNIEIPSFYEYLKNTNRLHLFNIKTNLEENLYTKPLSFKDELPRLIAQARLMYAVQKDILDKELPSGCLDFLDLGCGPGVYISMLRNHPICKNYKFTGLDISPEMILYARFTDHSNIWKYSSAYETNFESEKFDIVHASFLFIHLQAPDVALNEINRILKPGGILYVVDVIDNTFEGPKIIKRLIDKHTQIDEGNRNILEELPNLASKHNFKLKKTIPITINNTGTENNPIVDRTVLKLGRINMWAMFAFIGQRKEVENHYHKAEKHYFGTDCQISIQVHTQIYVKN